MISHKTEHDAASRAPKPKDADQNQKGKPHSARALAQERRDMSVQTCVARLQPSIEIGTPDRA
jgi:hypothetical protein